MPGASHQEWNTMVQSFAIVTTVLLVKYTVVVIAAADPENHPVEDSSSTLPPANQNIKRRNRSLMNDLENLPIHLLVFWLAFIIQNFVNVSGRFGKEGTIALTILYIIYGGARVLYSFAYAYALQPFRSFAWALGVLTVYTTAAVLIYSAFQFDATSL